MPPLIPFFAHKLRKHKKLYNSHILKKINNNQIYSTSENKAKYIINRNSPSYCFKTK